MAAVSAWQVDETRATWAQGQESATLAGTRDGGLTLTVTWPDLGLPGDGQLVLPVEVGVHAGVVTFAVTEAGLATAGTELLAMFADGTDGPTSRHEVTAAHSATVGAAAALPDRVMSVVWPGVFGSLAEAGLASSIFDLVHLRHEIAGPELTGPPSDTHVTGTEVARTEGGPGRHRRLADRQHGGHRPLLSCTARWSTPTSRTWPTPRT